MSEWKKVEVESNIWKPKVPGEELVGRVIKKTQGDYGVQVTVKTGDKKEVITPSHRSLQVRLNNIDTGDDVRIVFNGQGEAKEGQSAPQLYDVYQK